MSLWKWIGLKIGTGRSLGWAFWEDGGGATGDDGHDDHVVEVEIVVVVAVAVAVAAAVAVDAVDMLDIVAVVVFVAVAAAVGAVAAAGDIGVAVVAVIAAAVAVADIAVGIDTVAVADIGIEAAAVGIVGKAERLLGQGQRRSGHVERADGYSGAEGMAGRRGKQVPGAWVEGRGLSPLARERARRFASLESLIGVRPGQPRAFSRLWRPIGTPRRRQRAVASCRVSDWAVPAGSTPLALRAEVRLSCLHPSPGSWLR